MTISSAADRVRAVRSMSLCSALLAALILAGPLSSAHADITPEGNVTPSGTWTDSTTGYIGNTGSGTLTVNGGSDLLSFCGYIGYDSTATGVVNIAGTGSTWNNKYDLYVGNSGSGSLAITGGGAVSDDYGTIGTYSGSTGTVTVDGSGSTWTNSSDLYVGWSGNGSLAITGGGTVSNTYGYIGYNSGSTGTVTVDGSGSTWTNSSNLYVGSSGNGSLAITGGGAVTAARVSVNSSSLIAVDVGCNSLLNAAAGAVTNNGTIRLLAGAGVAANGVQYSPIVAGGWSGTGTYQAIGGTWSSIDRTFMASSVTAGTSSVAVPLDLASVQRALITDNKDGGTKWAVGASFVGGTSTTNISFTATAISGTVSDALKSKLPAVGLVLGGWNFSTDYAVSESQPIYLSFAVGAGFTADDFDLWHFDDTNKWTPYSPSDLTYDGNYASFTVTGLSGYAVTVPEPGTLALLTAGLLGFLVFARRK